MKKITQAMTCALAVAALLPAFGQEEEADETVQAAEEMVAAAKAKEASKTFDILPCCRDVKGEVECQLPGKPEWRAVEEGRRYPLGSSFRAVRRAADSEDGKLKAVESSMNLVFGTGCEVSLESGASVGTRAQPLGVKSRTVVLQGGKISVRLPRNLADGLFQVAAPGFVVCNLAGESRYTYGLTADGDEATVRCVTGVLTVKGRHFEVPAMRAANEIRLRTTRDLLFTGLYGVSGDYLAKLDQGLYLDKDFETGEVKVEPKTLEWQLSPLTAVHIHRKVPAVGERMSVSVMTFDALGELRNRCTFAEARPEINTGDEGPTTKKDKAEFAKKAAEATETVEASSDEGGASESSDGGASEESAPAEATEELEEF